MAPPRKRARMTAATRAVGAGASQSRSGASHSRAAAEQSNSGRPPSTLSDPPSGEPFSSIPPRSSTPTSGSGYVPFSSDAFMNISPITSRSTLPFDDFVEFPRFSSSSSSSSESENEIVENILRGLANFNGPLLNAQGRPREFAYRRGRPARPMSMTRGGHMNLRPRRGNDAETSGSFSLRSVPQRQAARVAANRITSISARGRRGGRSSGRGSVASSTRTPRSPSTSSESEDDTASEQSNISESEMYDLFTEGIDPDLLDGAADVIGSVDQVGPVAVEAELRRRLTAARQANIAVVHDLVLAAQEAIRQRIRMIQDEFIVSYSQLHRSLDRAHPAPSRQASARHIAVRMQRDLQRLLTLTENDAEPSNDFDVEESSEGGGSERNEETVAAGREDGNPEETIAPAPESGRGEDGAETSPAVARNRRFANVIQSLRERFNQLREEREREHRRHGEEREAVFLGERAAATERESDEGATTRAARTEPFTFPRGHPFNLPPPRLPRISRDSDDTRDMTDLVASVEENYTDFLETLSRSDFNDELPSGTRQLIVVMGRNISGLRQRMELIQLSQRMLEDSRRFIRTLSSDGTETTDASASRSADMDEAVRAVEEQMNSAMNTVLNIRVRHVPPPVRNGLATMRMRSRGDAPPTTTTRQGSSSTTSSASRREREGRGEADIDRSTFRRLMAAVSWRPEIYSFSTDHQQHPRLDRFRVSGLGRRGGNAATEMIGGNAPSRSANNNNSSSTDRRSGPTVLSLSPFTLGSRHSSANRALSTIQDLLQRQSREDERRAAEDAEDLLPTAIRSKEYGFCPICCSDEVVNPVGCNRCLQLVGCRKCANRWFRTGRRPIIDLLYLSADDAEPEWEGSCPLCRQQWVNIAGVTPMAELMAMKKEPKEEQELTAAAATE